MIDQHPNFQRSDVRAYHNYILEKWTLSTDFLEGMEVQKHRKNTSLYILVGRKS